MLTYLLHAFSGPAGAFMYALLAVMAFAITVIVERAWVLHGARCDGGAVIERARAALAAGKEPGDVVVVASGATPLERVVATGLAWTDPELAWDAMAGAAIDAERVIRRRIAYLSTVASVSTMIGLFGTVYGLILAFGALGDVAAAERAARLSEGSSTAMAATAMGLLVAIPALAAHAFLDARARELLADIERAAGEIVLTLKVRARR